MYDEYSDRVQFATVYVSEAHAADEWPIGSKLSFPQPRSLSARITLAQQFQRSLHWRIPLYVDDVSPTSEALPTSFEKVYASWPVRFYIISGERTICYIAQPVKETYDVIELREEIEKVARGGGEERKIKKQHKDTTTQMKTNEKKDDADATMD